MIALDSAPSVVSNKPRSKPVPKIPFAIFAKRALEIDLYDWQFDLLAAVEVKPVSFVICNGGGKSSVVFPSLILGFLYNFPKGRVAITSGSNLQLEAQLWPAIERYRDLPYFRGWVWNQKYIRTNEGGFAEGFSTDDSERLEGWHEDLMNDSPLLYVVDEAKAISRDKFYGIGRCTKTYYAMLSSAGVADGYFFDSFGLNTKNFYTRKVTSFDCPHVSDATRAFDEEDLPNDEFRAKHYSEFKADITGSAIPIAMLMERLEQQRVMQHVPGVRCAFCDFAAGGDENVLALRDGNRVEIIDAWKERNTTSAIGQFINHFIRLKLQPSEIYVDGTGIGIPMAQQLRDAGFNGITEVNNGAAAEDTEHYANRGSEIWFKAAMDISKGKYIIPDDKLWIKQAVSRKRQYNLHGKLMIEPKKAMMEDRKVPSPDRADAVLGAISCKPATWTAQHLAGIRLQPNPFRTPIIRF